jgi:hypothetical protein
LKRFTLTDIGLSPETKDAIIAQLPQTVTDLRLNVSLSSDNYYQLAKRNLSLTTFYVKGVFDTDAATTFLGSISSTLKHFRLEEDIFHPVEVKFPIMQEVETATLSHYPPNCTFEKCFPNLKVLNFSCMAYWRLSRILRNYPGNSSMVTTLTLPRLRPQPYVNYGIIPAAKLVGQVFDKLTTLVIFDVERQMNRSCVMSNVFEYIRHIESLTIVLQNSNGVYLDNILTGLPTVPASRRVEIVRQYPSIVDLTKLKTLTLTQDSDCEGQIFLTDVSVDFAFLYMPSLKSVTVRGFGFNPTPRCLSRLRDSETTIEIIRN